MNQALDERYSVDVVAQGGNVPQPAADKAAKVEGVRHSLYAPTALATYETPEGKTMATLVVGVPSAQVLQSVMNIDLGTVEVDAGHALMPQYDAYDGKRLTFADGRVALTEQVVDTNADPDGKTMDTLVVGVPSAQVLQSVMNIDLGTVDVDAGHALMPQYDAYDGKRLTLTDGRVSLMDQVVDANSKDGLMRNGNHADLAVTQRDFRRVTQTTPVVAFVNESMFADRCSPTARSRIPGTCCCSNWGAPTCHTHRPSTT